MKIHLLFTALTVLFACHAPAEEPFTFVQLCDPQLGAGGMDHDTDTLRKAVAQINELAPDFVVICGDFVENLATPRALSTFKEIIAGFEPPCHLVPGNHDVGDIPTPTTIGRYKRRHGLDHYDFEHKGYLFTIVNTQLWRAAVPRATIKHDTWFEETLAEGKEKGLTLVVAGHIPPYLYSPEEDDAKYNLPSEKRMWLLGLFEQYGVRLMLAGHLHANNLTLHKKTLIAATASTSLNRDNQHMGFRLWTAHPDGKLDKEYIRVEGAEPPESQREYASKTLAEVLRKIIR